MFSAFKKDKQERQIWSCELPTGIVKRLIPSNPEKGTAFPRESVYLPAGDIVLFADIQNGGVTIYDIGKNQFRIFERYGPDGWLTKHDPSVGLMYDPARNLVWGVEAWWNVYVLRFNPATAKFRGE